ncbi:MAG: 6-phosphogluconolactonase, eukaryotic type [uncultured Solirubrobacteraceae bacterium]|uniref:6-phosphogluconolactonase n=1 Tax=uncultured Solirubrobacteraceae bacterium TaxID=1162706 RepID=A0A6J4SDG4_9ACTN|nr:MAG: 6-phosphogluconolactonase, eukaryotic type [uncultured Solirubrobacteraceae bacterium]
MTRTTVQRDNEAAARRAADVMANQINDARTRGTDVHIAVAGGSTPRRAYELLAKMQGTWAHVHLWLGDERCVPADHPDANQRMIDESLISALRSGERPHLHPVRGELQPEDAAWLYASEIVRAMGEKPMFDFVLLGLGEDGHTASLFPGDPAALCEHAPVLPIRGAPKPPPERITLSLPVIRQARFTLLLATGEGKREALARVRAGDPDVPAGRLGDAIDEIVCDEAANQ